MGTFTKSQRPVLAGTYMDFAIVPPNITPPSVGSVVCVCFTHTWGPVGVATPLVSLQDFIAQFGGNVNNPTSGMIAVYQAFKGEGGAGFPGAGKVIAYRMASSSAAKAVKTLMNTAGTPANAITLSAKYPGTTGNTLSVTTQAHAADVTMNELIVLANGVTVLETYVYLATDITGLVAQINASSAYLTAAMLVTGVALGNVSNQALVGGLDGATLTGTDYTAAFAALELQRFGVLVFENLTDPTILASAQVWVDGQNAIGRRFFLVVGGAVDENIAAAIARSATLNDPEVVNVGVGHIVDNDMLDVNLQPIVLSTAQFAPRIAGILAYRGERYSLTFAKIANIQVVNGASAADIARAYDGGVVVIGRASDANATARIEKGLTSFVLKTDAARPRAIFSAPKFMATMHGLQTDLVVWANENIIGKTTVNNETRAAVLGRISALMAIREAGGSVQPGWSAYVDPSPPPSDNDPFIAFGIAAKFGRSTEQVFFTGQLG